MGFKDRVRVYIHIQTLLYSSQVPTYYYNIEGICDYMNGRQGLSSNVCSFTTKQEGLFHGYRSPSCSFQHERLHGENKPRK